MATILLVEETPDLSVYEAGLLEAQDHVVLRCGGGPSPFASCSMLREGSCALADAADLIVFSGSPSAPLRHRTYRGRDLLRAYRTHASYGCKPMMVVSFEKPRDLEGSGCIIHVPKFSPPDAILSAVDELLLGAARREPAVRASRRTLNSKLGS